MVWLSVTLLPGEKLSTLPEPRMPTVAVGVVILNLSLLNSAIAPVKARNVPFTNDKTVLPDASGLPLYWYWSMRNSVSGRIEMEAPSPKRNCAVPSLPDTMESFASTSLPRSALRSPAAFTTRTSPITKLNLPAAASAFAIGKTASAMHSTNCFNRVDFMNMPPLSIRYFKNLFSMK
jgi:hypothetical protein